MPGLGNGNNDPAIAAILKVALTFVNAPSLASQELLWTEPRAEPGHGMLACSRS